jgi:hypothetical protein
MEVPISNWDDLANLQIGIQTLPTVDLLPDIYLDGMLLEVEYDFYGAEVIINSVGNNLRTTPEESSGNILTLTPAPRKNIDKIFDPQARHKCSITPFSQEVLPGSSVAYEIILEPSDEQRSHEVTVGNLPKGIRANFQPVSSGAALKKIEQLILSADADAQFGSFNTIIIYRETQENNEIWANFCQLNLIVK